MKLPTLNIDLSVNTSGLQKKLAEAQADLNKFGQKALKVSAGGGLGMLGKMGGGLGAAATTLQLAGDVITKPFQLASMYMEAFAESVRKGSETMQLLAEGKDYRQTGLSIPLAANLAAAQERMAREQAKGGGSLLDTFFGAATDQYGNMGGVLGFLSDWASSIKENAKWAVAFAGAGLGGKSDLEAFRTAEMAVAGSQGAAESYMTAEELNYLRKGQDRLAKQLREQAT